MSILAQVTPTTAPTVAREDLPAAIFTIFAGFAVAFLFAWALGVFRKESIRGPARFGRRKSLGRFIGVTALGGIVWFTLQVLYIGPRKPETLTAVDFAVIATVPFIIGVIVLLKADLRMQQHIPRRLGWSAEHIPSGLLKAFAAIFIVMPLMLAVSVLLQLMYRAVGYEHPTEHRLLKMMEDAPLYVRVALAFGAAVCAPLFEEIFFRGHVQTILTRILRGIRPGRWIAVIVTSIIFSVIHEPWTAPIIFLLSMCLGYAYERTGNLWVPIFMHAMFNSIQTAFFLLGR